ncbi:MAG: cardiolipin synthase [Lactobacillaceae bacterium]|jgi:cardiolipin synthase|nr:cardiolipin synthase [Lactobacillaceae bacterium]
MITIFYVFFLILIINSIIAFITVFWSKREVSTIWAWLLVLFLLPVLGFVVFWLFGRRISDKRIFDFTSQKKIEQEQLLLNRKLTDKEIKKIADSTKQLIYLLEANNDAVLTSGNQVDLFYNGPKLFQELMKDIENAKSSIHIEFFTIYSDALGKMLIKKLEEKAKQGVEVRVIYDQFGSHGRQNKLYKKLRQNGGIIYPFLMRRSQVLSFRFNFRLHRKIVVIDGKTGYIGGFNVGDQYLGELEKFGNWRDTHLKVIGDSVLSLQARFFTDWNATSDKNTKLLFKSKYFPLIKPKRGDLMQIVSSGPDSNKQQIKQMYLKMFSAAKKEIIVQTPYLIPDNTMMETLMIALESGVKVKIMIPNKPDHPFVYRATEYYAKQLQDLGAEVFIYNNGFLHTKVIIVDEEISSIGSANLDIRSFSLNFEANAIIYSSKIGKQLKDQFILDVQSSIKIDKKYFDSQPFFRKFRQNVSRLLSPIL